MHQHSRLVSCRTFHTLTPLQGGVLLVIIHQILSEHDVRPDGTGEGVLGYVGYGILLCKEQGKMYGDM